MQYRKVRALLMALVLAGAFGLGALAVVGLRSASADPGAPNPGHEWSQVENHGIDAAGWWLGAGAGQALELRLNGARVLRLEPTSFNVIGGYSGNSVTAGAGSATIGGGGSSDFGANRVTDHCGTVGGGVNNQAGNGGTVDDQACATVSGGFNNTASLNMSTVGGGQGNTASGGNATVGGGGGNTASGESATVGGGGGNTASGPSASMGGGWSNTASGNSATVGGGGANTASSGNATVGGGYNNTASGDHATIGGGGGNLANSDSSTIGGGNQNNASGPWATIGGGSINTASGNTATVSGGAQSTASGDGATVAGGFQNSAGFLSTVSGGSYNAASGQYATVPGGAGNTAQGDSSFAAGSQAKANHTGSFVWADTPGFAFASTANNEFSARATGGVRFVSAIDGTGAPTAGVTLAPGGGSWSSISDLNVKANFTSVDGQDVLAALAEVPTSTWNYKAQDASIRHIGPMAQDFYAAFGLGENNTSISTVDADGVALAAIQGLYQLSQEQADRIDALETQNASLQQRLDNLEARVSAVEGGTSAGAAVSQASSSGLPAPWLFVGGGMALVLGGLVLAQRRLTGGQR